MQTAPHTGPEHAYRLILDGIYARRWQPGDRLSELALVEATGVSRTPVREALNRLATEGLIERRPGLGCFVRTMTAGEVAELYDLRELLEGYAAQHAAEQLGRRQLQQLADGIEQMDAVARRFRQSDEGALDAELHRQMVEADSGFHELLLEAAGCPMVVELTRRVRLISRASVLWLRNSADRREVLLRIALARLWHRRILRALRRGDGAAAGEAMRGHIRAGKHWVLRTLQSPVATVGT